MKHIDELVTYEHESEPATWTTFAVSHGVSEDGGYITEKVNTRTFDERDTIGGKQLRRLAEFQAMNTFPPSEGIESVDAIIVDPSAPSQYGYVRLRPGSVDCFHIVVNQDKTATPTISQNFPTEMLDLTVPQDAQLSVAVVSKALRGELTKPEGEVDDEILTALALCREAVADIEVEQLGRSKAFGASITRKLFRRQ